ALVADPPGAAVDEDQDREILLVFRKIKVQLVLDPVRVLALVIGHVLNDPDLVTLFRRRRAGGHRRGRTKEGHRHQAREELAGPAGPGGMSPLLHNRCTLPHVTILPKASAYYPPGGRFCFPRPPALPARGGGDFRFSFFGISPMVRPGGRRM